MKRLILASGSPRRKELLRQANLTFEISTSNVSEQMEEDLQAHELVQQLALKKAGAVSIHFPNDVVLGADTVVTYNGKVLGKPAHEEEARSMLEMLSGETHEVYTGCAIISGDSEYSFYVDTKVTFWDLTEEEIARYVASKEGFDKAGGYGIQGLGALHVKEIVGDYYNVVGLPLSRVIKELIKYGIYVSHGVN